MSPAIDTDALLARIKRLCDEERETLAALAACERRLADVRSQLADIGRGLGRGVHATPGRPSVVKRRQPDTAYSYIITRTMEWAHAHGGEFTAGDASKALPFLSGGYARVLFAKAVAEGKLERVRPGVYRWKVAP